MARAITQETQQLVTDLNEERSRYQNLLTEHLRLEEKYDDLKEEIALSSVNSTRTHSFVSYERINLLIKNTRTTRLFIFLNTKYVLPLWKNKW